MELDFVLLKTFDRNSQVRFHECMVPIELETPRMHEVADNRFFNHIWAQL
jgi:hypothetical protein